MNSPPIYQPQPWWVLGTVHKIVVAGTVYKITTSSNKVKIYLNFKISLKKIYFFHYCILLVLCRKHFQLHICSSIEFASILISKFLYLKLIRIAGICVALGVAHYRTTKHSQTANLRSTHIFPQRRIIVTTAKDSDDRLLAFIYKSDIC